MKTEGRASVEDHEKIRRAYFIEMKTVRQIARDMHVARKSARKAIKSALPEAYTCRVPRPAPILGPFKQQITGRGVMRAADVSAMT